MKNDLIPGLELTYQLGGSQLYWLGRGAAEIRARLEKERLDEDNQYLTEIFFPTRYKCQPEKK